MSDASIKIYHNPGCSVSRNTLALLCHALPWRYRFWR